MDLRRRTRSQTFSFDETRFFLLLSCEELEDLADSEVFLPYTTETSKLITSLSKGAMDTDRPATPTKAAVTISEHIIVDANEADDQEHRITLRQALQLYPKAIFWSVILSAVVIQEGYDTKLISALFAQPAFQRDFGEKVKNGYEISAPWQAGLNNGSAVGQLLGLIVAGHLTERYGFRKTMIGGLLASACCIFIPFFAQSLTMLQIGQVLFGKCTFDQVMAGHKYVLQG